MHLTLLKSKIHRATVTGASLHYEGSLTISSDLAALVDLREYEKILVGNPEQWSAVRNLCHLRRAA